MNSHHHSKPRCDFFLDREFGFRYIPGNLFSSVYMDKPKRNRIGTFFSMFEEEIAVKCQICSSVLILELFGIELLKEIRQARE